MIFELNGLNNSLIGKNDDYKKIIFRLDLFIEFAKIDFYDQNCYDYKKVLNFYLNVQREFCVYRYNDSYIERHKQCLNILKVFLSKKYHAYFPNCTRHLRQYPCPVKQSKLDQSLCRIG